jgi:hypothetical protein
VLQDYHNMYSKLRYVYTFCSKKKHINFLNQYQRRCWWRYGKARRNVHWAGIQRYWRIRKVRICSIMHCILMDWKAECKIVMCGDNKPFYLGHLNTWRTLVLSRFRLIVPSLTLMPDTAENIHRQTFPFFSAILNYTLSVGVIQH